MTKRDFIKMLGGAAVAGVAPAPVPRLKPRALGGSTSLVMLSENALFGGGLPKWDGIEIREIDFEFDLNSNKIWKV